MTNFHDTLTDLVSAELSRARGDKNRQLAVLGTLSGVLGMACAATAAGDRGKVLTLLAIAYDSALEQADEHLDALARKTDPAPIN